MASSLDIEKDFEYIIEREFEYLGYKCIILLRSTGFRYGYVGIPKEHPLYGKKSSDYYSYNGKDMRITSFIKPHNYGVENSNDKKFDYLSNDLWWFSFKCDHLGDNRDISSVKKKFKNGESELCKYILFCDFRGGMPGGMFCTEEYVTNECKCLAEQLKSFDNLNEPPRRKQRGINLIID